MSTASNVRRDPHLAWAVGWTVFILLVAAAAWGARFYFAAQREPPRSVAPVAVAPPPKIVEPPQLSAAELAAWREQAWEKIDARVDAADRAGEAAVTEKLAELAAFFRDRRAGVPPFAAEVLSFSGKWKYVKSKMPTAEDDAHLEYLNERFEQYVFPTADLRRTLESLIGGYLSRVEGLETQLLIDIRADLSDSELAVPGAPQPAPSDEALRRNFAAMLDAVAADVARDVDVGVSSTLGSVVAGEIAAVVSVRIASAVAARLGVSAGVLGAGAASSWATFGVGLAAAVVVDVALEKAIKAAGYDPVEKVIARVHAVLDQVQTMLIEGEPGAVAAYAKLRTMAVDDPDPTVREESRRAVEAIERSGNLGLRRELMRLHAARAAVRREALRRLIYEGEV